MLVLAAPDGGAECERNSDMKDMEYTPGAAEWSDGAPEYAKNVAALYRWSLNWDDCMPFRAFMDFVGYSVEEFGALCCEWPTDVMGFLGCVEFGLFADALNDYASRPRDVEAWVTELLAIEAERGA